MKRLTAAIAAALLIVTVTAAPAQAKDSGWGCGGACRPMDP